jgi:hypothetical protein
MRLCKLSFVATLLFLAATAVRGQNEINCDGQNCAFTFSFDDGINGPPPVVTGAPYSGQMTRNNSRTLPDGTHTSVNQSDPLTYRDSKGRLRTEQPVYRNDPPDRPARPDNFTVVEIQDPVAGYQYILDPVTRVAHRMPYKPAAIVAWQPRPLTAAGPPTTNTMPGGATWTNEPLGTMTISGITAVGYRITGTGTGGRGNRPFTDSDEHWDDPHTGVSLLSKHVDDYSSDEMIATIFNYSVAEPAPSLFMIPEGYKIVDETGPFRVLHPRAGGSGPGGPSVDPGTPAKLYSDWDGESCSLIFTPATGRAAGMTAWAFTGAPYSGREVSERAASILPDGTPSPGNTSALRLVARDSEGRVRTDPAPMSGGPGHRGCPGRLATVEILDPVAGYRYILDSVARVAYRAPYQASPQRYQPGGMGSNVGTWTAPNGRVTLDESLGSKLISGVTAVGHRSTQTSPPGAYMGNDKAVVQISETWIDPQTGVQLVSRNSGPNGDTTRSIPDYTTNPDPALFKIPDGYKVIDETGSFSFVVPIQKR